VRCVANQGYVLIREAGLVPQGWKEVSISTTVKVRERPKVQWGNWSSPNYDLVAKVADKRITVLSMSNLFSEPVGRVPAFTNVACRYTVFAVHLIDNLYSSCWSCCEVCFFSRLLGRGKLRAVSGIISAEMKLT
jgi:hypothetical protein